MKRCPECRRDYYDDSQLYCLDDGFALLDGPATDESKTAVLPAAFPSGDTLTREYFPDLGGKSSRSSRITGSLEKRKIIMIALAAIATAAGTFGIYRYLDPDTARSLPTFEKIKITKLTNSTKVISAAISPDGKYFAHVASESGQHVLYVRQTNANNDIQVVPLGPIEYWGVTFSKDSNDLYYVTRSGNNPGQLFRIPALGGTPKKILERI